MDNTTNEMKKEYITKEDLEKLSLEEVQNKIKKVEDKRDNTIVLLSLDTSYGLCNYKGFKKDYIEYLKDRAKIRDDSVSCVKIFSKEELKRIKKIRRDFITGKIQYKIKEYRETVELLEKIIPYQNKYLKELRIKLENDLKQQAIDDFCKLHPECYKELSDKPKMVRPKNCQCCGTKVRKKGKYCAECSVEIKLVEVDK